jgi:hypothetical protein
MFRPLKGHFQGVKNKKYRELLENVPVMAGTCQSTDIMEIERVCPRYNVFVFFVLYLLLKIWLQIHGEMQRCKIIISITLDLIVRTLFVFS